jgi:hypothetical protein
MTRRWIVSAAVVAALPIAVPHAQRPPADRFRVERPVVTAGPGPQRLVVDVPLLAGAEPYLPQAVAGGTRSGTQASGLSDLRFVDAAGAPVPYLLLRPPTRVPAWKRGQVLAIASTEKTSGFEVDLRAIETIDAIRLNGLPSRFLKRLRLEGSGDREHWTVLVAEGTLFDLPDEGLRQTELAFSPGPYRYVRITWNDANSGRVPPPASAEVRQVTGLVPPPPLAAALTVERRPSEPGRSRYRVKLPAARLPLVALELQVPAVDGAHVFRQAAVYESRLTGTEAEPGLLGSARMVRVVRDGIAAGALRIPIAAPMEADLDLVVDDESNPPLDLRGVTIVFGELPWIYLEAPPGPVVARYGSPTAVRPQYDLEAVRDSVRIGGLREATWGEPRRVEAAETSPNAVPMPEAGATLDAALFRYQRTLPAGPAGLVAVSLDGAALTHSRGPASRFADVRIVDAASRQIPYLVERRDEPLTTTLAVSPGQPQAADLRPSPGRSRSTYLVKLPFEHLSGARMVIQTSARVFQRTLQIGIDHPADRRHRDPWFETVATATWRHADQQTAALPLMLTVPDLAAADLWLVVDEGDNSALPISSATLLLPSYRLRFYQPAGASLRLAYGRDDLAPPQYDLALLAPQVMGVEAREIAPGPEAGSSSAAATPLITPWAFWVVLAIAVTVLLGLIVRLIRAR